MAPRAKTNKQVQQDFIARQVAELGKTPAAEEEIVYRLVCKFDKPHDGNTDWWRHEIRRVQGRIKNGYAR